jgi:hypothetical protein
MANSALLPVLSILLLGCEHRVSECAGELVASPDKRCTAQQFQTLTASSTFAMVSCTDGEPTGVIAIEGTDSGIGFAWTGVDALDVAVPPGATVIKSVGSVPGSIHTVRVNVRPAYGTESTLGCGIEQ